MLELVANLKFECSLTSRTRPGSTMVVPIEGEAVQTETQEQLALFPLKVTVGRIGT